MVSSSTIRSVHAVYLVYNATHTCIFFRPLPHFFAAVIHYYTTTTPRAVATTYCSIYTDAPVTPGAMPAFFVAFFLHLMYIVCGVFGLARFLADLHTQQQTFSGKLLPPTHHTAHGKKQYTYICY